MLSEDTTEAHPYPNVILNMFLLKKSYLVETKNDKN